MNNPEFQFYIGSELELFAHANNWKKYWSSKLKPLLGGSVLEVGAGIGSNTKLLYTGQHWTSLEPDPSQAEAIKRLCRENSAMSQIDVKCSTLRDLPVEQNYDSILYIDVLEHIEDDQRELNKAVKHLSDGGTLIVLAPAHQNLFSKFDESVGHFRRYNKDSLRKITPHGSQLTELYYLDSLGVLLSWLNAKILKSASPKISQIQFWDKVVVPLSKLIDPLTNFRLGKTIVAVWQISSSPE